VWFLPPLWLLAGTAALVTVGAVLVHPLIGVGLLLVTVPYGSVRALTLPEGVDLTVSELLIAVVSVSWVAGLLTGRWPVRRVPELVVPLCVLLVPMSLSLLVAESLILSLKELVKWAELLVVYLVTATTVRSLRQVKPLLVVLVLAALGEVLIGLYQVAFRVGPPHFLVAGVFMRAYGTFEQPNPYGGYLGLILPLAVAIALYAPHRQARLLAGVASGTLAFGLLVSLSRGAWLGAFVAVSVVLLAESQRNRVRAAALAYGGMAAGLTALVFGWIPQAILDRVETVVTYGPRVLQALRDGPNPANWAILERVSQWYAGWQMFTHHPLLGVGIGNYPKAYEEFALPGWPTGIGHAHNYYLNLAAEGGLLTFLAFLLLVIALLRLAVRRWQTASDPWSRTLALGLLGTMAAFATHSLFDSLFVHGIGMLLGFFFGLLTALPQMGTDSLSRTPGR